MVSWKTLWCHDSLTYLSREVLGFWSIIYILPISYLLLLKLSAWTSIMDTCSPIVFKRIKFKEVRLDYNVRPYLKKKKKKGWDQSVLGFIVSQHLGGWGSKSILRTDLAEGKEWGKCLDSSMQAYFLQMSCRYRAVHCLKMPRLRLSRSLEY